MNAYDIYLKVADLSEATLSPEHAQVIADWVYRTFVGSDEADTMTEVLDAIAGTMSAVLFDYTERMADKYGLLPAEEPDDHPHVIDAATGKCKHEGCDYSPFMGGEDA